MVGTTDMPKPNVETKTTRMVNEPKSVNEKMAMKVPIPKPKLQAKRLKKMTMKKNTKRRQLVKQSDKPKKRSEPIVEGEAHAKVQ